MDRPASQLPREVYGFDTVSAGTPAILVEGYHQIAHELAVSLTEDPTTLADVIDCDPMLQDECLESVLGPFLTRVFRRPLTADDRSEFGAVFSEGQRIGGDFANGVRAVIEVALQSPEFLYRVELGEPDGERGPGWARPTAYETASRLSYLLWGSTPDDELLGAADRNELGTDEAVEAQARRLLEDKKAREAIQRFYSILLPLDAPSYPAQEAGSYPGLTEEVARFLPEETRTFVTDLTFDAGGSFKDFMTAPHTWVNGPLAAFYGIPSVTGTELQKVDLDPTQRAGVLTQASIMAWGASENYTRPVPRGILVLRSFLCADLPVPPADVVVTIPDPLPADATTRERYLQHSQDPVCAGCHHVIDPIGFAFEHYDQAGLWRDTDNGRPIDATGQISSSDFLGRASDADGTFDGAIELAALIAESADARRCFERNWFEFSEGRPSTDADACSLSALDEAVIAADGNLLELLVALTQTDAFRYRPEGEVFR
jgi:hypothetical protein